MADADRLAKGTADKVRKLLTVLGEYREKETAILAEIDQMLGGGVSIGLLLKHAAQTFEETWATRYPGRYVWTYAKDRPHLKRLILSLGIEELEVRFTRYLWNTDPFFAKARHAFGAFVATVNQHAAAAVEASTLELAAPADCRHQPSCRSDVEHTGKRAMDLRADVL